MTADFSIVTQSVCHEALQMMAVWPAGIGLHEQILNRLELLCSKGMVVSVKVRCEQRR